MARRYLITARTEDGRVYSNDGRIWASFSERHVFKPLRQAQASAIITGDLASWLYGVRAIRLPNKRFANRRSPRYIRAGL